MNKQELYDLLDAKGIKYEVSEHIPVYTIEEMMAVGLPHPEIVAKNLFIRDDKKRNYYLITAREDRKINLKEFQEQFGTRKLSFASENDLAAILGLQRGAVTPFGLLNDTEKKVKFFIDEGLEGGQLGIHPLENTATVWINERDVIRLLEENGTEITKF